tara:strand:+ start:40 stop:666 length:627 start_codon:yes stop_codon:yes gene_type:complete
MHKLNILISAPDSFISTLNELKAYLKFNLSSDTRALSKKFKDNFDGFICHHDNLDKKNTLEILKNLQCFKILATTKNINKNQNFDRILKLPTSIREINDTMELSFAKKKFSKNSSITIKTYLLDKNEKKLIKDDNFIILTEKEIQLLELFLSKNKIISKKDILSQVWQYSPDVDTHTVETHIYRLRKKINDKFLDEKFIMNDKEGYYL